MQEDVLSYYSRHGRTLVGTDVERFRVHDILVQGQLIITEWPVSWRDGAYPGSLDGGGQEITAIFPVRKADSRYAARLATLIMGMTYQTETLPIPL